MQDVAYLTLQQADALLAPPEPVPAVTEATTARAPNRLNRPTGGFFWNGSNADVGVRCWYVESGGNTFVAMDGGFKVLLACDGKLPSYGAKIR